MATSTADATIKELNTEYEALHKAFENNFWATKMNLQGNNSEELAHTQTELDRWLGNAANLKRVQDMLQGGSPTPQQQHVLHCMERTFKTYVTDKPEVVSLKDQLNKLEAELAQHRNQMALGYTDPKTQSFEKKSSVQLSNTMRTNPGEAVRKAAYEGMRAIGPHIAERFCTIVKLRNRLAHTLGFEDYYDMKVQQAEGFSKSELFRMLAPLKEQTAELMQDARQRLASEKGQAALEPWNTGYMLAGALEEAMDPYFPFTQAVDVWARTFAGLGISYKNSTMQLDLLEREGKYSNGFCHWPRLAYRRADGSWQPSQANFTSLADPKAIGSGKTALVTLLHEGGHAAHFANVDQGSPLFSQERAPTSVAYAETQSMTLDSLAGDAAWLGRYALDRDGKPMPWHLIKRSIAETQPYAVFTVRARLVVPYYEKALYELPDDKVVPQEVQALADQVERDMQGGPSARPLLSVPHLLGSEASCYYHGYVLAEMAVFQTRHHFLKKYNHIVDNEKVGQDLARFYWQSGNGTPFLDLVKGLTGLPLTADAWVAELRQPVAEKLRQEEKDYEEAVRQGPKLKPGQQADLDMHVKLVHGDEVLADSKAEGSIPAANARFAQWIEAHA